MADNRVNPVLRQIPNAITVVRILLVVPIAVLLWRGDYRTALVVMIIAGLSDALDGALARGFKWTTPLGAFLDPIADKLLVIVLFVVFTIQTFIPLWLALIVVTRDVVILGGAAAYRVLYHEIEVKPTFVSKANTAMQLITLSLFFLWLCNFELTSAIAREVVNPYCFYILAVLAISSGVDYVVTWSMKVWRKKPDRPKLDLQGSGKNGQHDNTHEG